MGRFLFGLARIAGCAVAAATLIATGFPAPSRAANAGAPATADARAAADFYRGHTMFVIIGFPPGGGYDLYARLLAKHLGQHVPGNPTVIPQNMPGAGSLKAANYLYAIAPNDGSVIGTFAHGMGSAPLLGQARFDAKKFAWLGSITKDVMVCISWTGSAVKSWNNVSGEAIHFWRCIPPRVMRRISTPSSTKMCSGQISGSQQASPAPTISRFGDATR